MTIVLAHLNDPHTTQMSKDNLVQLLDTRFVTGLREEFGLIGSNDTIKQILAKYLFRYQNYVLQANTPPPLPQRKELAQFEKALTRTLKTLQAISPDNAAEINAAILYRPPFNGRFCFEQQWDYWKINQGSLKQMENKILQVRHAVRSLAAERLSELRSGRETKNTPLNHLIFDLSVVFEAGSNRKAIQGCFYDPKCESYAGQFFNFIIFILDRFAPKSYHSEVALGKRIRRILSE